MTSPTSALKNAVSLSRLAYLLTLNPYLFAPGDACHWKVTEVPYTVAPSLGEDKVGAEGIDVVSVSPSHSWQADPDTSNIPRSNTMVVLEIFTVYLQLIWEISSRMLCNNRLLCGHLFVNVFCSSSTLVNH